jgi:hypothetical protein
MARYSRYNIKTHAATRILQLRDEFNQHSILTNLSLILPVMPFDQTQQQRDTRRERMQGSPSRQESVLTDILS